MSYYDKLCNTWETATIPHQSQRPKLCHQSDLCSSEAQTRRPLVLQHTMPKVIKLHQITRYYDFLFVNNCILCRHTMCFTFLNVWYRYVWLGWNKPWKSVKVINILFNTAHISVWKYLHLSCTISNFQDMTSTYW